MKRLDIELLGTEPPELEAAWLRHIVELHRIFVNKNHDYGVDNIRKIGIRGVLTRMEDKLERAKNLLSSGDRVRNESLSDTFMDISNYSLLALMIEEGEWPNAPDKEESNWQKQQKILLEAREKLLKVGGSSYVLGGVDELLDELSQTEWVNG